MGSGKKYTQKIARYFNVGLFQDQNDELAKIEKNEIEWAAARKQNPDLADLRRRIFTAGLRIYSDQL